MKTLDLLKLGLRNLWRNGRRSAVTVLAIAFGFAAVGLFAGYTKMVYRGLTQQAVHGELLGHLTISKRGMATDGKLHPARYLLGPDEVARIATLVREREPGAYVAPRLSISGLLSNGKVSTIFLAEGIAPQDMDALRGPLRNASGALDPAQPQGASLARGLVALLGFKDGDEAQALTSTLHGQANALDLTMVDSFSTGNAGLEDKFMFMPLALAQSLYDAEGRADRLSVLLPDIAGTEAARTQLAQALQAAGFDLEIRSWQELSAFYRQVRGMFDMIFGFLLSIVLAIVVMSIANAMSMSVVERTREIGTLRAIGLRSRGVVALFSAEAALMVACGCIAGLVLTLVTRLAVNAAGIRYVPPNATSPVPLLIGLDWQRMALIALVLAVLSLLASFLPARRAARQPIIDSLGHV